MITAVSLLILHCIVWPAHKLYRVETEKKRRNARRGIEESDDKIISHPRGYWFSGTSFSEFGRKSRAEQRAGAGIWMRPIRLLLSVCLSKFLKNCQRASVRSAVMMMVCPPPSDS